MENMSPKYKSLIQYARSKGFLSPIWLFPNAKPERVKAAFQDLDRLLQKAYIEGELSEVTLKDISAFMWQLKKNFAFDGWEGIAPFLLFTQNKRKLFDSTLVR